MTSYALITQQIFSISMFILIYLQQKKNKFLYDSINSVNVRCNHLARDLERLRKVVVPKMAPTKEHLEKYGYLDKEVKE